MNEKLSIGITDCSKFSNYAKWFEAIPGVEVIKLSYKTKNYSDLSKCQALVLSGGEDVHPRFYDKPEYLELLDPKDIIEARDEFELKIIEDSLKKSLPILGICRGMQVMNVYCKGTLIPDIPSIGKSGHAKAKGYDQLHPVQVSKSSWFIKLVNEEAGQVNSAHHQAADIIGEGLKVSVRAEDGIVEGLEWDNPAGKSFLLLVQWHPERMKDAENPFCKNIRDIFIKTAKGG